MTDRIDLDELADEPTEDPAPNPGDWLWRDDTDRPNTDVSSTNSGTPNSERVTAPGTTDVDPGGATTDAEMDSRTGRRTDAVPHVPHPTKDKPVGIPVDGGGAGGGRSPESSHENAQEHDAPSSDEGATGPHGGDADDMTLAFTLDAIRRFDDPARVLADANQWADWIGIVGDAEAHVINKFQRDHTLDVDFFNGAGTSPVDRLESIGPHSMFYAERMVLVGLPGSDEDIAVAANWEFVPLETAASEADWSLDGP